MIERRNDVGMKPPHLGTTSALGHSQLGGFSLIYDAVSGQRNPVHIARPLDADFAVAHVTGYQGRLAGVWRAMAARARRDMPIDGSSIDM